MDTPYGRFEGPEAILAFAQGFVKRFHADGMTVLPMFQTRSGGRSVTEVVLNLEVEDVIDQVPMFVVADLCAGGQLEEARLYCHALCYFADGRYASRMAVVFSESLCIRMPS
ncbi:MAG: hypothetical protein IJT34_00140 [Butyrivibrio sp.]|nr:hypothetical protein [Butyrivibrio sp.]